MKNLDGKAVAKKLFDHKVVETRCENGKVVFQEQCDLYYDVELNPDEAEAFAHYINDLALEARRQQIVNDK